MLKNVYGFQVLGLPLSCSARVWNPRTSFVHDLFIKDKIPKEYDIFLHLVNFSYDIWWGVNFGGLGEALYYLYNP
jgi:hypothetical protein